MCWKKSSYIGSQPDYDPMMSQPIEHDFDEIVRLLFLVFCSLFSVNQSISTVVCSSQLYSEGGGASQPRSKQVSEDNSLRGNHVYTYYVGELQSLNFYHHVQCCM